MFKLILAMMLFSSPAIAQEAIQTSGNTYPLWQEDELYAERGDSVSFCSKPWQAGLRKFPVKKPIYVRNCSEQVWKSVTGTTKGNTEWVCSEELFSTRCWWEQEVRTTTWWYYTWISFVSYNDNFIGQERK